MKCKGCGKVGFKSKAALAGHQRWCEEWPGSPRYKGKQDDPAAATPPPSLVETPVAAAPAELGSQGESFYPPLADWRASPPEASSSGADLEAPSLLTGEERAKPGATEKAIFDTTGLWHAAGNFVDSSLLKDKDSKVGMTDAKAKLLDGSLHQLGIMVEAPAQPLIVAYWMPFMFTVLSVFVLPVVLAYVPDLLKNIKLPAFLGGKKEPEEPEQEVEGDG